MHFLNYCYILFVRVISLMSTHKYYPRGIAPLGHVSPLLPLLRQPSRHLETSRLNHLCSWATHISPVASNLLLYARPWLVDTRLTNGILPILTSTSVDRHVKSQAIGKIERTTNCVMTLRLTQPLAFLQRWWLSCYYYTIITTRLSSILLSLSPPLNTIKILL